jgi:hypothetical protein
MGNISWIILLLKVTPKIDELQALQNHYRSMTFFLLRENRKILWIEEWIVILIIWEWTYIETVGKISLDRTK